MDSGPAVPPAEPEQSRGRASFEFLLGSRGLAAAGMVVSVIALGLFLKLGWDQGWLRPSPTLRVFLGAGAGFALLALSESAARKRTYAVLAQVLAAGGVSSLYLSGWAAHSLYRLVSPGAAFALVSAAAALGVGLAVVRRARWVALLSTIGGFLAPATLPLEAPSPAGLYVFLTILNLAVLATATFRRWPETGAAALLGSAVHAAVVMSRSWEVGDTRLLDTGWLALTLVVFLGIATAGAGLRRRGLMLSEQVLLVAASLLAWGGGLARLTTFVPAVRGAWTLLVMVMVLAVVGVLFHRLGRNDQSRQGFMAVAAILGVALPVVLWQAAGVAAAWAVQSLALAVAAYRIPSPWPGRLAGVLAAASAAAAVVSFPTTLQGPWLLEENSLARLTAAAVLLALLIMFERRNRADQGNSRILALAAPAFSIALFSWFEPEVRLGLAKLDGTPEFHPVTSLVTCLLVAATGAALLAGWRLRPHRVTAATGAFWLGVALVANPAADWVGRGTAVVGTAPILAVILALAATAWRRRVDHAGLERALVLGGTAAAALVAVFWRVWQGWPGTDVLAAGVAPAVILFLAAMIALLISRQVRSWPGFAWRWPDLALWLLGTAAVSRLTATAVLYGGDPASAVSLRAAGLSLSVVWGGAGVVMLLAGLVGRAPWRRWAGLTALGITVIKVFAWDLASAPSGIRIVAVLACGGALVVGSFLYARLGARLKDEDGAP